MYIITNRNYSVCNFFPNFVNCEKISNILKHIYT